MYRNDRVIIKKYNRDAAVLLSVEDYEKLLDPTKRLSKSQWDESVQKLESIRADIPETDPEEIQTRLIKLCGKYELIKSKYLHDSSSFRYQYITECVDYKRESPPLQLYKAFITQQFLLITSSSILAEVEDVINRENVMEYHKLSPKQREAVMEQLLTLCYVTQESVKQDKVIIEAGRLLNVLTKSRRGMVMVIRYWPS